MGRIKQDHSGYRTHGIWLKYQSPTIDEKPIKATKKKDTNKWCRGKVGAEHDWHRYQDRKYDWEFENGPWISPYVHIKCYECNKTAYKRMGKATQYPLHLYIYQEGEYMPIQVRVNGKFLPIPSERYGNEYYCWQCMQYHVRY